MAPAVVWPAVLQGQRAAVSAQSEQLQRRLAQLQGQVRPSPSARKRGRVASQASAEAVLKQVQSCLCLGVSSKPAACQAWPEPTAVWAGTLLIGQLGLSACLTGAVTMLTLQLDRGDAYLGGHPCWL